MAVAVYMHWNIYIALYNIQVERDNEHYTCNKSQQKHIQLCTTHIQRRTHWWKYTNHYGNNIVTYLGHVITVTSKHIPAITQQ
jgi:hypothetical protein